MIFLWIIWSGEERERYTHPNTNYTVEIPLWRFLPVATHEVQCEELPVRHRPWWSPIDAGQVSMICLRSAPLFILDASPKIWQRHVIVQPLETLTTAPGKDLANFRFWQVSIMPGKEDFTSQMHEITHFNTKFTDYCPQNDRNLQLLPCWARLCWTAHNR